jgi:hypothetical protein
MKEQTLNQWRKETEVWQNCAEKGNDKKCNKNKRNNKLKQ